jgi:hypothetical protein
MTTKYANVFECYAAIGKWLDEEAPEPWERVVVEFKIIELDDVSERTITYTPLKKAGSSKQFSIYDTDFTNCFYQLARLTSTPEKGSYKKCKFTLFSGGKYKTDFEY